ncbi:hypothetical protein syc0023_d [Synechococcus elongatus PCC 6301]|uniref:Co-chaperone DjlA N-terminal domain-containing protein n=1 Tax=Synechococcus sp. (strain ATCC 27144 / PCC 6301 / SAUG 1402/1) TaxID=269084 RepID=A0A0H3K255_SYNP6|nr:hypothetical protein syc0023_d [Synechococcus elongatus PCC 6301]
MRTGSEELSVNATQRKLLMQLVIGAAWVDGDLDQPERQYLQTLLERQKLDHDPDLLVLLETPIGLPQLEAWLVTFLQGTSTPTRLAALATIANLLMADGVVNRSEHSLLDEIHSLMAQIPASRDEGEYRQAAPGLVQGLSGLVRRALNGAKHLFQ